MGRPRSRAKPSLVVRGFERSRLEEQLLAAAYELAVPVVRRSPSKSSTRPREEENVVDVHKGLTAVGGLTA
jgi:hypothetical protein